LLIERIIKDLVADNISNKKQFNWYILFIFSLASIVMGIYRDGITSLFPFLQKYFDLTRTQLGLYITSLYLTSSIFGVFSGRLVDSKGSKWGIVYGTLSVGILIILHSIATNFIILIILAAIVGLGLSINAPAANKGITGWFPYKWRSTATGIWSTAFPIGGILAASILPILGVLFGWRKAFLFPGIFALFCSLFILIFYKDNLKEKNNFFKNKTNNISFWKEFNCLIKNFNLVAISVYGFFLGTVAGAISTHFALFLYLDYGLNETFAGLGFAIVQLGSVIGRVGWGLICDIFFLGNRRKVFLFIGILFFLISLIYGLFLKTINTSILVIFLLAFLVGFTGRGWNGLFFSYIPKTVGEEQVGIAIGLAMAFLRGGLLISPPIFGYIADIRNSYDLSWIILGLTFLLVSFGQYICCGNRKKSK